MSHDGIQAGRLLAREQVQLGETLFGVAPPYLVILPGCLQVLNENRGISPPCFVVCQRRPGGPFQAVRPAFPEVCVCGLGESARTRNLGGGVVLVVAA